MSQIELVKARTVRALEGLHLEVEFSHGSSGVASLEDFVRIGPMMAPLNDPAFSLGCFSKWACRPGRTDATSIRRPFGCA